MLHLRDTRENILTRKRVNCDSELGIGSMAVKLSGLCYHDALHLDGKFFSAPWEGADVGVDWKYPV